MSGGFFVPYGNPTGLPFASDTSALQTENIQQAVPIAPPKRVGKLLSEYEKLLEVTEELSVNQQQELLKILLSDPILQNVPATGLSSEYVDSLIRVETGQAFPIHVLRGSGDRFTVIVSPESTVKDIKLSVQHQIAALEEPLIAPRKISWAYVWKRWVLVFDTLRLSNDKATTQDLGLYKDAELKFARVEMKKRRELRAQMTLQ